MADLVSKINELQQQFELSLSNVASLRDIESVRIEFLGKKSHILAFLKDLKDLSSEDKRVVGPQLNVLKMHMETSLTQKHQDLVLQSAEQAKIKERYFDVTAYKPLVQKGHLHPYTQFTQEVEDIFISMGYEILDGPELETDFYNFTGLNIRENHPARDMYDTFWTNLPNYLLRTHTSPVQVRTMQTRDLPIAAIVPGRVYRHEALDASHDAVFMQCEGFFIDKHVTLSHLFATAQTFLKAMFKKEELDIRIRPGFFPFVEPGFEIDMRCQFCLDGCSVCKKTTWMEVFPGGLIHPNVLRAGGIDPEKYSGFAFGFGLSRLAMLKYNIDDIRLLYGGKLKFLEQF